ncbi:unnamed protein product [Choristocarpus tenellus]
MINSLQWRQAYSNNVHHSLKLESGHTLRFRQLQSGEITGLGTGATVWPAAIVLVKYMERRYGSKGLQGLRVVDLGSGTGAVGIAAAALGAEAYLTDQKQLNFLMLENADICSRECGISRKKLHVTEYDWGGDDTQLSPPVDVIVVSDCVLPKLYPIEPLINAIDRLSGSSTVTLLSYEHRYYEGFDPRRKFEELAAACELGKVNVPQEDHHPIFSADDIEIWEVRRKIRENQVYSDTAAVELLPCQSGETEETVVLLGECHQLKQEVTGTIGCNLSSALVIARHLVATTSSLLPHMVLELGSGLGLVAMVTVLLGWDVVATDKEQALPLLRANLERCLASTKRNVVGRSQVMSYEWGCDAGELLNISVSGDKGFDLILCADCLYTQELELLLKTLLQVCHIGTTVLVSNELTSSFDEFLQAAQEWFIVEDVQLGETQLDNGCGRNIQPNTVALKRLQLDPNKSLGPRGVEELVSLPP